MPSVSRAAETSVRCQSLAQLCNVGIAARRYHLRTGHLPTTLNDLLSAKLLDQIPTDPFSGQPIHLKAQQDQIIIYSVGPDGRDDGGDYLTNKDITFRVSAKPLWEIDAAAAKADQEAVEQRQGP